ncbi:MAG: DUF4340 domain-containing protein [Candidatus Aminicenantes bacterium]|nr:DUF4340 domain-containing protein [Candidatus Aminicenantes bacterium]
MKTFRTAFILLFVFVALLAVVLFFEKKGQKDQARKEKEGQLIDVASADIEKITLMKEDGTLTFEKDAQGTWRITEPLEAGADSYEVNSLADTLASLRFERVVEAEPKDLATYEIAKGEVALWLKGQDKPLRIMTGLVNPLDQTLFAKREDQTRVVLLPSTFKTTLEKKLFDFRQKDIFKFDTAQVARLKVKAKDTAWEAARRDDAWYLEAPVKALARKTTLDTLLDSLSNLRAKEFLAEAKTPEELKKRGLDKPGYEVELALPAASQNLVFSLSKDGETMLATTSQSTKIISFDGTLITDLEKKVDDLRDKKVVEFYSWEADRVAVKKEDLALAALKEKVGEEETWRLETEAKETADRTKVEDFIRQVEGLEAAEFIDTPGELGRYGLDKPFAEVLVRTKDGTGKVQELTVQFGAEDKDKKQVIVRNPKLDYLFRVDSAVLESIPKAAKDWLPPPPQPEEKKGEEKR